MECAFAFNVGEIEIHPKVKRETIEVEIQVGSSAFEEKDKDSEKSDEEDYVDPSKRLNRTNKI